MSLEDHVGDVVGKARRSLGMAVSQAAQLAGLSEADYEAFEENGLGENKPDLKRLAENLDLSSEKLERIAAGWTPAPVDLASWREMRQVTTTEGMAVNAYLVWDEVTRDAAVFDTGWSASPLLEIIEREHLTPRHLFITHTHADHVAALGDIRKAFPKIRLHSSSKNAPVEQRNRPNDFVHLGSLRISNRDTPGHADDGVTYVVGNFPEDAPHVAIVGDAIFAGSIGGPRDQAQVAKERIRSQILSLPDDTLICPGHGPLTTVGEEKANNPFFI